jgi:hypothetical protein
VIRRRAALLGAAAASTVRRPASAEPGLVRLADSQGFTKGPFTAFMAPWNKGGLRFGTDYTEELTLSPATFPAGSRIAWNWPPAGLRDQVRGFLAIDFGNYYNTVPEAPIRSSRASGVERLVCRHDLSIGGTISGFNAIVNFFLTATPDPNSILFEVEVFLHASDAADAYMRTASSLGTFTSASGLVWTVARDPSAAHGPDFLFRRADGGDLLAGEVDLREMLGWLAGKGAITGGEFFNGLALGVEPQQRDGTMAVNAYAVDYA